MSRALQLPAFSRRIATLPYRAGDLRRAPADRDDEIVAEGIGTRPDTRHRKLAAWMLSGRAVEMPTTLTDRQIVLALVLLRAAASGLHVHVASFDDGAGHMALALAPVLDAAGVPWDRIAADDSTRRRKLAYRSAVVFSRASDLALDHLRGREKAVLRADGPRGMVARVAQGGQDRAGLFSRRADLLVVLDGHDTLCERSLTSMIISDEARDPADKFFAEAFGIAMQLRPSDWRLRSGRIELNRSGRARLAVMTGCMGPEWSGAARAELAVSLALSAIHVWRKGRDYRIDPESGIEAIGDALGKDAGRGGVLDPVRALAIREGLADKAERTPVERITLRGLCQSYPGLCGFVADAARYRAELKSEFGLRCRTEPPRCPDVLLFDPRHVADALPVGDKTRWLPILLGGTDAEMQALVEALSDAALQDRLCAPLGEIAEAHGPLHHLRGAAAETLSRLRAHCPSGTGMLIMSRDFGHWPETSAGGPAVRRVALVPCPLRARLPAWMLRPVARWQGPAHLLARRRLRAMTAQEAELRHKIQKFDKECRNAVSFMSRSVD